MVEQAYLEEINVVGGIPFLTGRSTRTTETLARPESLACPAIEDVQIIGCKGEAHPKTALTRQFPLGCTDLPFKIAADVVLQPIPPQREDIMIGVRAISCVIVAVPSSVRPQFSLLLAEPINGLIEAEESRGGIGMGQSSDRKSVV